MVLIVTLSSSTLGQTPRAKCMINGMSMANLLAIDCYNLITVIATHSCNLTNCNSKKNIKVFFYCI